MALSTSPLLLDRISFLTILSINLGANILFAADFIYLGELYAQLPGSDLNEYLKVAIQLVQVPVDPDIDLMTSCQRLVNIKSVHLQWQMPDQIQTALSSSSSVDQVVWACHLRMHCSDKL